MLSTGKHNLYLNMDFYIKLIFALGLILNIGCKFEPDRVSTDQEKNSINISEQTSFKNEQSELKISYIGNMGVLFEHKDKTVLIDGFHEKYKPAYVYPTKLMVDNLMTGRYHDFSKIEVGLITHKHGDHFSPSLNAQFLHKNPNSIIVGSNQIKEEIKSQENDEGHKVLLDRVLEIKYDHTIQKIEHEGISIKAIRCDHSNQGRHKAIKNIAFLVDLNGYSILHVGDTYWDLAEKPFQTLDLLNSDLDVAVLPYWMLTQKDSKNQLSRILNPKKIIATHVSPDDINQTKESIQLNFPQASVFTQLEERLSFAK